MNKILSKSDLIKFEEIENQCRVDPQLVIDEGLLLLSKYSSISTKSNLARLYKSIGFSYCFVSKFEEALKNTSIALDGFLSIDDKSGVAECYFNIGTVYFYAGNYSLALVNYKKSLDVALSENNEPRIANAYNGIGSIYYSLNQNESALSYLSKALKVAEQVSDEALCGRVADGLAKAYLNIDNLDKAIYFGEYALKMYKELTIHFNIAQANIVLGKVYLKKGMYDQALLYYKKAIFIYETLGNEKELLSVNIKMAEIYLIIGKNTETKKILIECDKLLIGKNYYELEKELIYDLIKLAKSDNRKVDGKLYERLSSIQEKMIEAYSKNSGELISLNESVSSYENIELKRIADQIRHANLETNLLSQIGKEITSCLSIDHIIETVYEKVNHLMPAPCMNLGVFDKEKKILVFPATIEKGVKFKPHSTSLDQSDKLPVVCFNQKREIIINDTSKEVKLITGHDPVILSQGEFPDALIYLPLLHKEEIIGVISVQSFTKNVYTHHHVDLLRSIAIYVSIAVENAQLYENREAEIIERTAEVIKQKEEIEKAYDDIQLLSKIGQEITSSLKVDEIINKSFDFVSNLLKAEVFGVGLINEEQTALDMYARERNEVLDYEIDLATEKLATICFNKQTEIIMSEWKDALKYISVEKYIPPAGDQVESIIYLPIIHNEKCIGVITVQSFSKNAFQKQHLHVIKNLSNYVLVALENAKAYENLQTLSLIGKEITSTLNLESVLDTLYMQINKLMDATIFLISSFNKNTNKFTYELSIENNERIGVGLTTKLQDERKTLSSWAYHNKTYMYINDWEKEAYFYVDDASTQVGEIPNSLIFIPLIIEDQVIGMLSVQSFKKNAYSLQHLEILKSLSSFAAIALNNAESFNELEIKRKDLEKSHGNLSVLSDLGKQITSSLDFKEVIHLIYKGVNELMDASMFGISTYNEAKGQIENQLDIEFGKELEYNVTPIDYPNSLAAWCILNNKDVFINDNETEITNYVEAKAKIIIGEIAQSIMFVPLVIEQKPIGLITAQSLHKNAYTQQDLTMLKTIGSYASVALSNSLSHKQLHEIGEIGKEITSLNSMSEIHQLVYDKLQDVMSLNGFGVGIHNQLKNTLDFNNYIEDGVVLGLHSEKLSADRYSTYCFNNHKIIHLNNEEEGQLYIKGKYETIDGDDTESIIYVPLMKKDKCIGVLTVQALKKNVFSKQDVILVQNLASYVAVAIENTISYANLTQLSLIGKEITSLLNIGTVVDILHERLSSFLDTTILLVGLYDEKTETVNLVKVYEEGVVIAENVIREVNDEVNISSYCIIGKKEVFIKTKKENRLLFPNKRYSKNEGKEPESVIYLPLIYEDKVLGVLSVQSFTPNAYSEEHLEILRNVASYLTVTINNIRSYETLHYIGKIGQQITSTLDLKSIFSTIYNGLNKLIDAGYFIIALYDKDKEQVIYRYVIENNEVLDKEIIIDVNNENYPGGWAIRNKKMIHVNDLINEYQPYVKELKINYHNSLPSSVIYKPLIYENEVVGLLSVQSNKKHAYGPMEVQIIDSLSSYATSALQNGATYEALEKVKSEMEKLSIVASETDNAIIIADNKGKIEWVNEAFTEMSGYTLDNLLEQNKITIQSLSTFEGISEKIMEVLLKKESVNYEGVLTDNTGNRRFVQTNLTPILDEKGEVKKLVAIDADITLQKLAEIEIREKNKDITDSINYAKRIQTAILPNNSFIKSFLPNSFIYFEPRDIVSGDFYWLTKTKNNEIIVAAVDCTGHGVPGAFLTIIGNNLLNQIVNIEGETSPGKILKKMNIRLLERFSGSNETRINDGMDMSICKLKSEKNIIKVTYSGAFNPMYYVVDGELFELYANRFAIGTPIEDTEIIFEEFALDLGKDSMIYLFSDGYSDQLGGEKGKKFMKKRFKEFLISISENNLDEQYLKLRNNFKEWSGNNKQIDDVLVIGIKI